MGEELVSELHNLLFSVRLSIRYHIRRLSFFDGFQQFTNAISIILGSAVAFMVFSDIGRNFVASAAVIVTVFSAINLIVTPSQKARLHGDLARRFSMLEREMISREPETITQVDLHRFTVERLDIEQDEPPNMYVLTAICYNEVVRSMGYGSENFAPVKWYQRLFANILDIRADLIQLSGEKRKSQLW